MRTWLSTRSASDSRQSTVFGSIGGAGGSGGGGGGAAHALLALSLA